MLIVVNIEVGGDGVVMDGIKVGDEIKVVVINDLKYVYEMGRIVGMEVFVVGCNVLFVLIVDLICNWCNFIIVSWNWGVNVD